MVAFVRGVLVWSQWPVSVLALNPLLTFAVTLWLRGNPQTGFPFGVVYALVFWLGGLIFSYSLALRWNLREATRLFLRSTGSHLQEIPVPDFARAAVPATQGALRRFVDRSLDKNHEFVRFVTVVSRHGPREVIPYCIYNAYAPSLICLPFTPDGTTLFGHFQVLHEMGHATMASDHCLIRRYQYAIQIMVGGLLIATICHTWWLWIAWVAVVAVTLFNCMVGWYIEREQVADRFALSHLKLGGADPLILVVLEELWDSSDVTRIGFRRALERKVRLDDARSFWLVESPGYLDMIASGLSPSDPSRRVVLVLLCLAVVSGIFTAPLGNLFAWILLGSAFGMLAVSLLIHVDLEGRQQAIKAMWNAARNVGPMPLPPVCQADKSA